MSFWKDVGNFLDDAGSSTGDAFSTAWTFAGDKALEPVGHALGVSARGINTGVGAVGDVLAFPGRHVFDNPASRMLGDVYHSTIDHPFATYGRVVSNPNSLGVFNFFLHPSMVADAWHTTGEQDLTAGQGISGSIAGKLYSPDEERNAYFNSWAGKLSSGAADFAVGWEADPLVIGGKAIKASRIGTTTLKGNEERTAMLRYAEGRSNKAQVGSRAAKLGDRFNRMIESTDGLTDTQLVKHPALASSADAGALAYLFAKANAEHAGDLEALHATKRTIFGAALGDPVAINRLKASRTELADEMASLATPPSATRYAERFSWNDHGQGAWDFFNNTMDPLDQRLAD